MQHVTAKPNKLDFNPQFRRILEVLENTSQNLFITGPAGTGKSTLLQYFRAHTKKNIAVLAPTGIAAVNVQGQTIHSFFRFKPSVTFESIQRPQNKEQNKKTLFQKLDTIIIDEISMVRADLLDCIDRFLRLNGKDESAPFGGLQMIFMGDLYQLPPVVPRAEQPLFQTHYDSPYFFSARCYPQACITMMQLETIYRQTDNAFIELLNAIRNNTLTPQDLHNLNQRYQPNITQSDTSFFVFLTPTNAQAETINTTQLDQLKGSLHTFHGKVTGDFSPEYFPTNLDLHLKKGAQVMMLNNDTNQRWRNGTLGRLKAIKPLTESLAQFIVTLENGETVTVMPHTWEIHRLTLENDRLVSKVVGTFTHYPLKLAWALTIHKSQGKTFDKVVVDMGRGAFAHGQTYVALSRCKSLQGLTLKTPLSRRDIWVDKRVIDFMKNSGLLDDLGAEAVKAGL